MELVSTKYPKATRYTIYIIFVLLLAATLTLGTMSILRSLAELSSVGESAGELRHQVEEKIQDSGFKM